VVARSASVVTCYHHVVYVSTTGANVFVARPVVDAVITKKSIDAGVVTLLGLARVAVRFGHCVLI